MTLEKLSASELKREAEELVFKHGGWLAVASRLETSRDSLYRTFMMSSVNLSKARDMLSSMRRTLEPAERENLPG